MTSTLLQRATTVHPHETDTAETDTDGSGQPSYRTVDVRIVDGVIAAVGDLQPGDDEHVEDLDGYLLLGAAVEPHAHLDKAFLSERIANPSGDLLGAIDAMRSNRHLITVDETIERAERAARLMAANGYCAVRTHADTTVDNGLLSIEALVEVKRRVTDLIDVEIVALCGCPLIGIKGSDQRALLHDAMAAGADLVGGVPHLEDGNTRAPTEYLLQVATDFGVGVDLHTDETLDPDVLGLVDLAEMVSAGFDHPATASHCVSLGMQSESRQRDIAEQVAAAGISVIALPHTNLFLQGRGHAPMPRGLTAVQALQDSGVNVAAGADNLQDPFNPVGRACPFETAGLMIMTSHQLPHVAWDMVSSVSAVATGRAATGIEPGRPANLIVVRADTVREAIASGTADRRVWRNGVTRSVGWGPVRAGT